MKTMKRMTALLLVLVTVFSLTACGSKKTLTMRREWIDEQSGIPMTDTWTIAAKGKKVQTITEVLELDLSEYESMVGRLAELYGSTVVGPAKGIDGVTCTDRIDGTTYIIKLTVDCTDDAAAAAVEAGPILQIEGVAESVSLKFEKTQSSLEEYGYEVAE